MYISCYYFIARQGAVSLSEAGDQLIRPQPNPQTAVAIAPLVWGYAERASPRHFLKQTFVSTVQLESFFVVSVVYVVLVVGSANAQNHTNLFKSYNLLWILYSCS